MQWYEGDKDGIEWTLKHELYHNIQYKFYSDAMNTKDMDKLQPNEALAYQYLTNIYKEGTATYVSDVFKVKGNYVKQH